MNQDELILGFQKALSKQLELRCEVAVHRKINDGMDDFCGHYPMEQYVVDKLLRRTAFATNLDWRSASSSIRVVTCR
jgi:hypothetical protein